MMWEFGAGWWLVGAVFMVICMVMMGGMMGHGHSRHREHGSSDDPERTLANRLARGEIDIEEYHRLLEALRDTDHPARAQGRPQFRPGGDRHAASTSPYGSKNPPEGR